MHHLHKTKLSFSSVPNVILHKSHGSAFCNLHKSRSAAGESKKLNKKMFSGAFNFTSLRVFFLLLLFVTHKRRVEIRVLVQVSDARNNET